MSSRHRRRSKKPSKARKFAQNHNVTVVKLIDPIVQSLLIIFFIYCIDLERAISYRAVLLVLIAWQVVSVIFNFFLGELKLLQRQRIFYFVTICAYMTFFFIFERHVREEYISIDDVSKGVLPLHRVVTMSIAIAIAFWYNVICYKEIRTLLGGVINTGKG